MKTIEYIRKILYNYVKNKCYLLQGKDYFLNILAEHGSARL